MPNPNSHLFEVQIVFEGITTGESLLDLILPVWRSGRYFVFDFSGGVQEFKVSDGNGKSLDWNKTDKSTWRIKNQGGKIIIEYKVFANEAGQRTRGLDEEHGFINGTSIFMFSEKYKKNPLILNVEPYGDWQVTTGLDRYNDETNKFKAPDYDYFIDCPLEIGRQIDFDFEVEGRKHIISFCGEANYEKNKLIKDFTKIIEYNYKFWGSIPYEKYVFIVHCSPKSGGGTEHINSTVVGVQPKAFETESGYTGFLNLISHEFFHTWNVKQLKPAGLTPYDYTKENYTRELWIAEGCTSYYDGLIILRTGQMKLESFFKELIRCVVDERSRPGNKIQPVTESSFDAWVKFWKRNENAYLAESDYYAKGSYVSIILDLEIRNSSQNKHSLDDVMRTMYERFPHDVKGYTNDDFQKVCEEFSGADLTQFFEEYVFGTESIEWEKYFLYTGLELKAHKNTATPIVGIKSGKQENRIFINEIIPGSSADKIGMKAGDEIIALNDLRLGYDDMEKRFKSLKAGESVKLTVFRNNEIKICNLKLEEKKLASYSLEKVINPTPLQKSIYESWLNNKW